MKIAVDTPTATSEAPLRAAGAFGPDYPGHGWVPSPRYILRRDRVLRFFAGRPPGETIEVGAATGALLSELAGRGHRCTGLEISAAARATANAVNAGCVRMYAEPDRAWRERFDNLLSLEVLEHIEDDAGALAAWAGWLKPGGVALLSVPAGPERWNGLDVWAGHYRRYSRASLAELVAAAGLKLRRIESYGFPLASIIETARAVGARKLLANSPGEIAADRAANTMRSGVERPVEARLYPLYRGFPGALAMHAAVQLQRAFTETSWGNGLLAIAEKSHADDR